MDEKERLEIALWRIGVLGPLVSARLEHGDIREHIDDIVKREHRKPDGQLVELSASTIERWYYDYKQAGFEALHPTRRSDCGKSKAITGRVADLILRAKQDKPRRSIKIIIRMLERAKVVTPGELTRSTVHRFLQSAGISNRPLRAAHERRSFIAEHAGDLWIGDALHGPRVIGIDGKLRKSYLLSQIDNATRFLPHSYFAESEDAPSAAAPPEPLTLQLVGSEEQKIAYLAIHDASMSTTAQSISDLDRAIVNAISSAGQPVGRTSLRDKLRVRNERLGEALTRLAGQGVIARIGDRWAIPIPAPTGERERNASA